MVLLTGAAFSVARPQSVLEHPPNVSGDWVVPAGRAQFNFQHRFESSPAPARKVTNYPTLLLGFGLPGQSMLGFNYSTNSRVAPAFPNEWEFFGRWRPLTQERGAAVDLGGELAYNLASEGVDAEVSLGRRWGRLGLIGLARALTDPDTGAGGMQLAVGGGATLRLRHWLAVQGDYVSLTDRPTGQEGAWSAGIAIAIPTTPHSFSLYASNALTSTLQGASRGTDKVRYGFEFVVPLTLSRWFGTRAERPAASSTPSAVTGPVRTIVINRLSFTQPDIEVAAGTTVIWRNDDQLEHTVTADDGTVESGMIPVGRSFSHTFNTPGTFTYHCTPHPFMKGRVVVR
jgi:amicyanin